MSCVPSILLCCFIDTVENVSIGNEWYFDYEFTDWLHCESVLRSRTCSSIISFRLNPSLDFPFIWEIRRVKDAYVITTTYNNNFIYYIMNWKRRSDLFNRITSDTGHVLDELLPPKRNKVLRERGHDDFILPRVKTERFKPAFVNGCPFKLSLNIFQLKLIFNFVIHMIGFFHLSLVRYWL